MLDGPTPYFLRCIFFYNLLKSRLRRLYHLASQPTNANHLAPFICDFDVPNLNGSANPNRSNFSRNGTAFPRSAQVAGIDFRTNDVLFIDILQNQHPSNAAKCFGQNTACSAMEHPHWLNGVVVNGHGCNEEVITNFCKANTDGFANGACAHLVEAVDGGGSGPNHFVRVTVVAFVAGLQRLQMLQSLRRTIVAIVIDLGTTCK